MWPKIFACIAILSGLLCLFCTGWLIFQNLTAKNLVFAASALAAAMIGTAINAWYELQPPRPVEKALVSEYMFDRLHHRVGQFKYEVIGKGFYPRPEFESDAGYQPTYIGPDDPIPIFDLAKDFSTVSFIEFLLTAYPGWRGLETRVRLFGGESWSSQPADGKECKEIDVVTVREKLAKAGNVFAKVSFWLNRSACLPPAMDISIQRNEVTLSDFRGSLTFRAVDFLAEDNIDPFDRDSGFSQKPLEGSKSVRFSNVATKLTLVAKINWGYSKHREIAEYQAWQEFIIERADAWFKPFPYGKDGEGKVYSNPFIK